MRQIRAFVAVQISPPIRDRAKKLIELLRVTEAKVKWVEPQNLHLTLKFLGDVESIELPRICKAVADATAPLPPFEVLVAQAGAFPSGERPRTIWLGATQGQDEMVELHQRVERALSPLGFREEQRRFRPHLTLGRVRQSPYGIPQLGELLQQHRDYEAGAMFVSDVVVVSSELSRTGPVYDPLATIDLAG
jgi:2'-5' RNA ligase